MTASELIILLLVLVSALTINTQLRELEREAEAIDLLKGFEFTSYNLLFDLCSYLRANENFTSIEDAKHGVNQLLEQWCSQINSYAKSWAGHTLVVHIESLLVEEYSGQTVDNHQMRFAGGEGGEKWLVTGELYVEFLGKEILFKANHRIRLAI